MFFVSRNVVDECFHVDSFNRKTFLKLLREFLICSRSSHTEKIMIGTHDLQLFGLVGNQKGGPIDSNHLQLLHNPHSILDFVGICWNTFY